MVAICHTCVFQLNEIKQPIETSLFGDVSSKVARPLQFWDNSLITRSWEFIFINIKNMIITNKTTCHDIEGRGEV